MAAHGYLIYSEDQAALRTTVLQRLGSAGDNGDDLLDLITQGLGELAVRSDSRQLTRPRG